MSIILGGLMEASTIFGTGTELWGMVNVTAMQNPFPGAPDFTVFGVAFDTWWKKLFAAVWALAIIVAGFFFIVGLMAMAKADANNPHAHQQGKEKAMGAGIGLIALAGLGVILGAILTLAS